jgi:hypothetical protein
MDGWMDEVVEDMRKMGSKGGGWPPGIESRGKSPTGSQGSQWVVALLLMKVL